MSSSSNNLAKVLLELNLQAYIPALEQYAVDLTTMQSVSVVMNGEYSHLRMAPSLQSILLQKCGLNQSQILLILQHIKKRGYKPINSQGVNTYSSTQSLFEAKPVIAFPAKGGNKRMAALLGAQTSNTVKKQQPSQSISQLRVQENSLGKNQRIEFPQVITAPDFNSQQFRNNDQNSNLKVQESTPQNSSKQTGQVIQQIIESEKPIFKADQVQPQLIQSNEQQFREEPKFKSPPMKEVKRIPPIFTPNTMDKCDPLKSLNNLTYIEQKLQAHRESIIQQYGSSKVPTPTIMTASVLSKMSPQQLTPQKQEIVERRDSNGVDNHEKVMIDFDDELSQVINPINTFPTVSDEIMVEELVDEKQNNVVEKKSPEQHMWPLVSIQQVILADIIQSNQKQESVQEMTQSEKSSQDYCEPVDQHPEYHDNNKTQVQTNQPVDEKSEVKPLMVFESPISHGDYIKNQSNLGCIGDQQHVKIIPAFDHNQDPSPLYHHQQTTHQHMFDQIQPIPHVEQEVIVNSLKLYSDDDEQMGDQSQSMYEGTFYQNSEKSDQSMSHSEDYQSDDDMENYKVTKDHPESVNSQEEIQSESNESVHDIFTHRRGSQQISQSEQDSQKFQVQQETQKFSSESSSSKYDSESEDNYVQNEAFRFGKAGPIDSQVQVVNQSSSSVSEQSIEEEEPYESTLPVASDSSGEEVSSEVAEEEQKEKRHFDEQIQTSNSVPISQAQQDQEAENLVPQTPLQQFHKLIGTLKEGIDQSCQWSPQKQELTPSSMSPEKMEQIILEKLDMLENQIKLTDPYVAKTPNQVPFNLNDQSSAAAMSSTEEISKLAFQISFNSTPKVESDYSFIQEQQTADSAKSANSNLAPLLPSSFCFKQQPIIPEFSKRKVQFDDFCGLNQSEIETRLLEEEDIAHERGTIRKKQEEVRKVLIQQKRERREARRRLRLEQADQIEVKSEQQEHSNLHKRQREPNGSDGEDEEVESPEHKRPKLDYAQSVAMAIRGPQFQTSFNISSSNPPSDYLSARFI